MTDRPALGEVLFEFTRIGNAVRVSAIHVASGLEVTIMGPASAPQSSLRDNALQKLRYMLAKQ